MVTQKGSLNGGGAVEGEGKVNLGGGSKRWLGSEKEIIKVGGGDNE